MERLSSYSLLDGSLDALRLVSNRIGVRAAIVSDWVKDKGRQVRSLPGNETLMQAVFAADTSPVEGSRHRVGECLKAYSLDGECQRFKICGAHSGGFSNVYTVIDLDEMEPYCLKESRALPGDEHGKNRKLAVEAEIALRLGIHPNIVVTNAAFFIGGRLFIQTEYVPGTSLDRLLNDGPLSIETALAYGLDICGAIIYSQEKLTGFVHGDIKPDNCFVTTSGSIKLGDFGLASAVGMGKHLPGGQNAPDDRKDEINTYSGWGGTAAYMAPELFEAHTPNRNAVDVYAFGATLFEMLGGERPFSGPSKGELVDMHRHQPPPIQLLVEKNVPTPIVDLIQRCLAKSPNERPDFGSARDVIRSVMQQGDTVEPIHVARELTVTGTSRRALSLALLGNYDQAIELTDSAIRQHGRFQELLSCKALVCLLTGRIADAFDVSTSSLKIGSDNFAVLLIHARALMATGKLDAAEIYLHRALRLHPDNCVALELMGELLVKFEDYDEAISCFSKSLTYDDQRADSCEAVAKINCLLGQKAKAIDFSEKALAIDPHRAASHKILADVYLSQDRFVDAIKSFKAALRLESSEKETVHCFVRSCSTLYRASGKIVDGQLLRILLRGARFLQKSGERRIAPAAFIRQFVDVLGKTNFDPLLLFFLDTAIGKASTAVDSQNLEELHKGLTIVWPESKKKDLAPHLLYSLGRSFYHCREYAECESVFTRLLKQIGPNEQSFYYLAACAEIQEDFYRSLKYYKKAFRIEDSEDARTGIQRIRAKLKLRKKLSGKTSLQGWARVT